MRRRWAHTAPAVTQPEPPDNTSRWVLNQVRAWVGTGVLIHPESAMEIAAWWQGPAERDMPFTQFAGTGAITAGLAPAIRAELEAGRGSELDHHTLAALLEYVRQAADATAAALEQVDRSQGTIPVRGPIRSGQHRLEAMVAEIKAAQEET